MDGSDPLYDRDEVHAIYREWRNVFNEYDPPRMAVAETWHPTSTRTYLYARSDELGQVFDFSLLKSHWDRDQYQQVIQRSIEDHRAAGGGLTWVLSSHDIPRHASRLALPIDVLPEEWLVTNGTNPVIDPEQAVRRARAATLIMLALPGSAYLFQGEELGLLEVADLPVDALTDPVWERSGHTLKGRDGCRVPLPWATSGTSFGFGANGAWLPQPHWLAAVSVQAQDGVPDSTLQMYRAALQLRRKLQTPDGEVSWADQPADDVLDFSRSNGWRSVTNFSPAARDLPPGKVIFASGAVDDGTLPPETTVWLQV
jgi:alpha-glucosidase